MLGLEGELVPFGARIARIRYYFTPNQLSRAARFDEPSFDADSSRRSRQGESNFCSQLTFRGGRVAWNSAYPASDSEFRLPSSDLVALTEIASLMIQNGYQVIQADVESRLESTCVFRIDFSTLLGMRYRSDIL